MPAHDAIVLGLGGMGSAAAFHLAARGGRVLALDAFEPPHDRGSSHGATRVIRQAYFEHPAYVPLLLRAYELWKDLESATGRRLLLLPGGLMMGAPDSEVVQGSLRSAQEHGLDHETLDTAGIRRRFPQFKVPEGTVALFEAAAGLVFCESAVQAHLEAARHHGAELRFHERVVSWKNSPEGVEVVTSRGRYSAARLVVTPGPWAPEVLRELGLPLTVERQVLCWFDPPAGIEPYLPERFPIYIWQRPHGVMPYGFPAVDGPRGGVKIALYRSATVEVCTPETVDRRIRAEDESSLRSIIRELLPGLDGPLLRGVTCLYTLTPDLNFVIDQHPGQSCVWIAAGFSGHGFKFCSVIGEILADLAIKGETRYDLRLFSLRRLATNKVARK
jgi:sarcosine oxidase